MTFTTEQDENVTVFFLAGPIESGEHLAQFEYEMLAAFMLGQKVVLDCEKVSHVIGGSCLFSRAKDLATTRNSTVVLCNAVKLAALAERLELTTYPDVETAVAVLSA